MKLRSLLKYLYESDASELAKKLGLQPLPYGNYADPNTGKVVAKSIRGRLVKVEPKDEPQETPSDVSASVTTQSTPVAQTVVPPKTAPTAAPMAPLPDVAVSGRPRKPFVKYDKDNPEPWLDRYCEKNFYAESYDHLKDDIFAAAKKVNSVQEYMDALVEGMEASLNYPIKRYSKDVVALSKMMKGNVMAFFNTETRKIKLGQGASEGIENFKYLTPENLEKLKNVKDVANMPDDMKATYQALKATHILIHELVHAKERRGEDDQFFRSTHETGTLLNEALVEFKARTLTRKLFSPDNEVAKLALRGAYDKPTKIMKRLNKIDPAILDEMWQQRSALGRIKILRVRIKQWVDDLVQQGLPPQVRSALEHACTLQPATADKAAKVDWSLLVWKLNFPRIYDDVMAHMPHQEE